MLDWLPENIATYGDDVDSLFRLIYYLTLTAFLLWEGALIYMLFFFRRKEGQKAMYLTGDKMKQAIWTLIPFAIVIVADIVIDINSSRTWARIKTGEIDADVNLRVMGEQFNWQVYYPGPDGEFETADDLNLENSVHVPVDKKVKITLTSKDVIHSFFVPVLRLKQDALPGRRIDIWFEATKTGVYEIPCAELCGFGHSGMLGYLTVHSPDDYEAWFAENWPQADSTDSAESGVN